MTIQNARGKEGSFKLDKNGFEIVTLPERERDVSTDEKIKEDFMPEVVDVIKKRFHSLSPPPRKSHPSVFVYRRRLTGATQDGSLGRRPVRPRPAPDREQVLRRDCGHGALQPLFHGVAAQRLRRCLPGAAALRQGGHHEL